MSLELPVLPAVTREYWSAVYTPVLRRMAESVFAAAGPAVPPAWAESVFQSAQPLSHEAPIDESNVSEATTFLLSV